MTNIGDFTYRASAHTGRTAALSVVLVLGFGTVAAEAQTIHDNGDRVAAVSDHLSQNAVYNGYGAGYARGSRDSVSLVGFEPRGDEIFEQGTNGYSAEMGPVVQYRSGFRQAYERGYGDGYHGRGRDLSMVIPPVPSHPGVAIEGSGKDVFGAAATNGYNAGYKYGADARRGSGSFAYHDAAIYKNATEGFGVDMGGRIQYQSMFRLLYARGYSDGFNGRMRMENVGLVFGRDERVEPKSAPPEPVDVAQFATATGYHHGYERGISNKRAGQSLAYRSDEAYYEATTGYENGWDKKSYRTAFRSGYLKGYSDGYRRRARNKVYEDVYTQYTPSTP
jgi:hypothetical protein